MKILKGDQVKILLGKDKGRIGEVIKSFPKTNKIIVKGLNMFKKHIKAQNGQKGTISEKERSLLVSKTSIICPSCNKSVKVGYNIDKLGVKSRICKKCQAPFIAKK